MKPALPFVLVGLIVLILVALLLPRFLWRVDPRLVNCQADATELISGLQEYRKFVGEFPKGPCLEIAKALTGKSDTNKKVLIYGSSTRRLNNQGELVDPWGTPLQIFFSHNSVLVRSAGPNCQFDDDSVSGSDDLFYSDAK